ncbi:hypothetical protein GQX74_009895, partial [Glossina fuscipes]
EQGKGYTEYNNNRKQLPPRSLPNNHSHSMCSEDDPSIHNKQQQQSPHQALTVELCVYAVHYSRNAIKATAKQLKPHSQLSTKIDIHMTNLFTLRIEQQCWQALPAYVEELALANLRFSFRCAMKHILPATRTTLVDVAPILAKKQK